MAPNAMPNESEQHEIICGVCQATNASDDQRCVSCGARLLTMTFELSESERAIHRYQQQGFSWKWVVWSAAVMTLSAFIVLCLAALLIPFYDPQGFVGVVIVSTLWLVCGIGIGYVAPVHTFVEPAVGGLIAVVPTMTYLAFTADVYRLSTLAYVVGALMAIMTSLIGGFIGHYLREERNFRVWTKRFGASSHPPPPA